MRSLMAGLAAAFLTAAAPAAQAGGETAHAFSFPSIEGGVIDLGEYAGRPILVVNTASRCGFTRQYDGLQAAWERYRDRGLVVVAAPSDTFNQELSGNDAVRAFCEARFGLTFPMTEILSVRGDDAHPFFAWVADQSAAPSWNFTKYLIGADGRLIARFGSAAAPTGPAMTRAIERALSSAQSL